MHHHNPLCNMSDHSVEVVFSSSQEKSPMVSVIVPTCNRPDMLSRTLHSILEQTYNSYEVVVVNDCGMDVGDIVASLNEKNNITYIMRKTNGGACAARNTGIKHSRGKYIAYLDDDDIYYPNHLETLVNFLESSDYKVAYTDAYRVLRKKENGAFVTGVRELKYSYDFDYDRILVANFVPVLCVIHEKACLDAVGLFDESIVTLGDWDLWIRLSRKYKLHHIKKITSEFYYTNDGSSMLSRCLPDRLGVKKKIYKKYAKYADKAEILAAQKHSINGLKKKIEKFTSTGRV